MRRFVDKPKVERFMAEVGRLARGPGVVYITGGATALLLGIRQQTVDIDLKLDPEPEGVFEAIAALKESLGLNVELAAPDQFIPTLPGWRDRSRRIMKAGPVEFRHYDFYAQALAKIERAYPLDLSDAGSFVRLGLVELAELGRLAETIRPELIRYPSIEPDVFAERVQAFLREHER